MDKIKLQEWEKKFCDEIDETIENCWTPHCVEVIHWMLESLKIIVELEK